VAGRASAAAFRTACVGGAIACLGVARGAAAVDLPKVGGAPITLDVTETAIAAQRFEAREGEKPEDQGYFAFLNRLNAVLTYKRVTVGARIDASLYEFVPEDRTYTNAQEARNVVIDGSTRYRDAVYPAKLWVTYKDPTLEATAGDSYVQFGRGLVLSLRKVDELGIDTTLLGGKLSFIKDPFALTVVAGIANPARVDEPTGRALFVSREVEPIPARGGNPPQAGIPPTPLLGSDRIVGAQIQAGRGLAVTSSTHAAFITRCAPYSYNADGTVNTGAFDTPIGTCNDSDTETWLSSLPPTDPTRRARQVVNAGQSLEVPNLWGHGSIYVEAAVQKRDPTNEREANVEGNAIYGSFTTSGGPVTNVLEVKSYRNFYPVGASINTSKASAFLNIAYSAPPTAEAVTQDNMFGFFNACVTGARDRVDYLFTNNFLAFVTAGYFVTLTETPGGQCDRLGRSTADKKPETHNDVFDGTVGIQWKFDDDKSIALANVNGRYDVQATGREYYRELAGQYSVTKYIKGPYSFEIAGRHRYRIQADENVPQGATTFEGEPYWQGEHQNALKIAPKWVLSQGFEYTTFIGLPTYYLNGGVLYRFTSQSNIRLYGGQNRGGLRCVNGICRYFPSFSGVRVELTLRF
jgi:hypothetical protein